MGILSGRVRLNVLQTKEVKNVNKMVKIEGEIVFMCEKYPVAAEQVRTEFEAVINLLEEKFKLTSSEAIQLFKEMFNADYSC